MPNKYMKTSTEQKVGRCKLQSYQICNNSANQIWKAASFAEYMEQWLNHCWWGYKSVQFLLKAHGLYEGSWRCSNPTRLPVLCMPKRNTSRHTPEVPHPRVPSHMFPERSLRALQIRFSGDRKNSHSQMMTWEASVKNKTTKAWTTSMHVTMNTSAKQAVGWKTKASCKE